MGPIPPFDDDDVVNLEGPRCRARQPHQHRVFGDYMKCRPRLEQEDLDSFADNGAYYPLVLGWDPASWLAGSRPYFFARMIATSREECLEYFRSSYKQERRLGDTEYIEARC